MWSQAMGNSTTVCLPFHAAKEPGIKGHLAWRRQPAHLP